MSIHPKFVLYLEHYLERYTNSELTAFFAGTETPSAWKQIDYVNGPAIRDCYVIEYCNAGEGQVTINNHVFPLKKGQSVVLFPGSIVTLESSRQNPWAFTWVHFHGTKVAHYLENMGVTENTPLFPWEENQDILDFMLHGAEICVAKSPTLEFEQKAYGNTLFAMLARACIACRPDDVIRRSPQRYISQALQYIEANFIKRVKVSDIAAHIGLNRTYFSTLFREEMGQTPQEFLIQYRIQKACEFFTNPQATVASVAYSLGYEPHVFSRVFKQVIGKTPQEYKESLNSGE